MGLLSAGIALIYLTPVAAQNLDSDTYTILDATLDNGGGTSESGGSYSLLASLGDFSSHPGLESSTYRIGSGIQPAFLANAPEISCFETSTNGSSACSTGPAYLNTNGMVRVCGSDGCYNRARFEIDVNDNPTDTLYGIQISTDNFVSDIQYIDGISFTPEDSTSRTLADYLTKSNWEIPTFNLRGLYPATNYYIRVTAVHGDFTESEPGPIFGPVQTSNALVYFDIDVAPDTGVAAETNAPYLVDMDIILRNAPATSADDLIWLDFDTNAAGGTAIVVQGLYGGLNSISVPDFLASMTTDLDVTTSGFGLQEFYSTELYTDGITGNLATLTGDAAYVAGGNNVGAIATAPSRIFYSNGPVESGRVGVTLKARADNTVTPATDYSEEITFTVAGLF